MARYGAVLALGLAVLVAVMGAACDQRETDPAAVRVDGHEVPESEVRLQEARLRLDGDTATRQRAVAAAIDAVLVSREAQRRGLSVDDDEVQARLAVLRDDVGGAESLAAQLAAVPMTRSQLEQTVRQDVLRAQVSDALFASVRASRRDARRFYDRRRALFTIPATVDLGTIVVRSEGIAENALARLREGSSWEQVARQFTVDPEGKQSGGRAGVVALDSLPGPLAAAIAGMRPGEVKGPVPAMSQWWVLKLFGREPRRVTPFAKVAGDVQAQLTRRRRDRRLEEWLTRQRAAVTVESLR